MSDRKRNQNTPDDQGNLRGGTQGGNAAPMTNVGSNQPGGTNSLDPTGSSHPIDGAVEQSGGTRTDSRFEPEEAFEGTRRPSPVVSKERARDDADVDTTPGRSAAPKSSGSSDAGSG